MAIKLLTSGFMNTRQETKNPIEFIYFDLGGVLFIDLMVSNRWDTFIKEIGVPLELESSFNNLYDKYEWLFNTGQMHTEEFVKIVEKELGIKLKVDSLLEALLEQFYPNKYLQLLLPTIQQKFKTGLLTNMYIGMLNGLFDKNIISREGWEVIIDSNEVGLAKPDKKIFEFAQKQAKVSANNILFVDNSQENIGAARNLGWQTFLYDPADIERSNQKLRKLLEV